MQGTRSTVLTLSLFPGAHTSAMKGSLGKLKGGLKRVEDEIMVATMGLCRWKFTCRHVPHPHQYPDRYAVSLAQISAVKGSLGELKGGLKMVEDEIMVATGIDPGARAGAQATHQDFGQLMARFHETAAGQLQAAEVRMHGVPT
jgi:hypothetical protein